MKIISWNVNGVRSAFQKGLMGYLLKEDADIVCLQEIKAWESDFPKDLLSIPGYTLFINPAEKKGYSGTAVFTKQKPTSTNNSIGFERFDKEGRMLELKYPNFTLINFYIPHGGRLKEKLPYKLDVYNKVLDKLAKIKADNVILMGDFNVAHHDEDLARPHQNRDNIMFTPEERKQLDLLTGLGYIDSLRYLHKGTGLFTWWPYAFDARVKNIGWRIDYGFVSQNLGKSIADSTTLPNVLGSDHCPIKLTLQF